MPTITLSPEFFRKERDKAYTNWKEAWWRENFQNSLDAKSTRLDVEFEDDAQGNLRIIFSDNGTGMTPEVIENVYLCLGKTTKEGTDSVGGFGRARILTCFSMEHWSIVSGTVRVDGHGISYEISSTSPYSGVRLEATMPPGVTRENMREALVSVLRTCTIESELYIEGERYTEWLVPGEYLTNMTTDGDPWGSLYEVEGNGFANQLLIRVHGLTMFTQWTQYNKGLILQLDPGKAREVLSSNRDGLMWKHSQTLSQLLSELATEGRKALRPKLPRVVKILEGMGMRETRAKRTASPKELTLDDLFARKQAYRQREREDTALVAGYGLSLARPGYYDSKPKTETIEEKHQIDFMEHFVFEIDTQNINIRRASESWNPLNWRKSGGRWPADVQAKIALLRAWQECCAYMIELYAATFKVERAIRWTTGWTFSDLNFAECRKLTAGHAFLLNPLNNEGALCVNYRSIHDRKNLLGKALHEVCHIDTQYHDSVFSDRMTQMVCIMDQTEALRRINVALKGM